MRDTVELTADELKLIMTCLYYFGAFVPHEVAEDTYGPAEDLHDQLASLGFSRFEGHREGLKVTLEVRDA